MIILFLISLLYIGLFIFGYLISLRYRQKTVNVEKLKVNLNYMSVAFISMLATTAFLGAVDTNLDLINLWIRSIFSDFRGFSSKDIVCFAFVLLLILPMSTLFFIIGRKKRESKKTGIHNENV
jgi:hypothetical protein